MNQHEVPHLADHRPDLVPGLRVRSDRSADREPAMTCDLGCDEADPAHVEQPGLVIETQSGRQELPDDVAVEERHRTACLLADPPRQRAGDGRLAGPRQAGEHHDQTATGTRRSPTTQRGEIGGVQDGRVDASVVELPHHVAPACSSIVEADIVAQDQHAACADVG